MSGDNLPASCKECFKYSILFLTFVAVSPLMIFNLFLIRSGKFNLGKVFFFKPVFLLLLSILL